MAKYSLAKRKEKREIGVLEDLLNTNPLLTQFTRGDDDFPLIDGYIHLLSDTEEIDGNMLKVQVKPLKTNKDSFSATCGIDLLSHAHSSSLPILLIAVDPDARVAYWKYFSPESVRSLYEKQVAAGKKSATMRMHKNHVIKEGVDSYLAEWKRICLHHRNSSNDRLAARYNRRIKRSITANEDALLERIKTLQDLVFYRTNKGEYPLIEVVLEMSSFIGGTSTAVKSAYIELLEQIVHDKTPEVLEVFMKLANDESEQVRSKTTEALKNASKYNYHVLNAIGYGSYRAMLDFIGNHEVPSAIAHEVLRNLLDPDYDGTSQTDMYTLTFHRGPLDATPFLKKLRRDALELLLKKYKDEISPCEKVKIVMTIGYVAHKSDSPFPSDPDFLERSVDMVEGDTAFIVAAYKKIIFTDGEMTQLYPVVYEVESQISLFSTRERKIEGVDQLLQQIREDKGDYRLFSLLAGDEMRLRHDIEWREGKKLKEEELGEIFSSINEENADEWYARLDMVASFRECVEDWLYQALRDFLGGLGEKKPQVAEVFAERALEIKTGLHFFLRSILWGFRKGSLSHWNKYVSCIAKYELTDQVDGILMSYFAAGTELPLDGIREEDVEILLEIATKSGRFSFLKSKDVNRGIEYHSLRALALLSTYDKKIRPALLEKMAAYPELDTMFLNEIGFALHCGWIKLNEWDKSELEAFAEIMVEVDRIDHYEMQILHALGVVDFDLMMSVFERRIKHPYNRGYDAIPYHFEETAAAFIRENQLSKSIVKRWLEEMDADQDGMVGYHLGEFFERVGGEVLREALSEMISTGKKENILKVMEMLPVSDPADPTLCLEIVAATDDKSILDRVDARMRQTGGGTGAVGENIFAREMRRNQARIEKVKEESTDPKIIGFCERVHANLARDIERSEREHEREMQEERQEYEDEQF